MHLIQKMEHRSSVSAVAFDESSTMETIEEDTANIGILGVDPGLEPFREHFKYRVQRYAEQKKLFEKYEAGLEEFAKGNM